VLEPIKYFLPYPQVETLLTIIFQTAVLPTSLTDAAAILRTDHVHSNVGILFELGVTYIRNVSIFKAWCILYSAPFMHCV